MKRQTFNVLFFIRKTRTVKSGETPIMLRITIQVWGIERSGFFNGREKWVKGFESQMV